jgi:hypothetical protein
MRHVELAGYDANDVRDHPLLLVAERDVPFPIVIVQAADLTGGNEGLLSTFQVEPQEGPNQFVEPGGGELAYAASRAAVV